MAAPVVFDAYGTLFDLTAAARRAAADHPELTDLWPRLSAQWRQKQLEYTWLRTIGGPYADFDQITADALDYVLAALSLPSPALRARLLQLYAEPLAFDDVGAVLAALRGAGHPLAILSNGTPAGLHRALGAAGLAGMFDAVLSADGLRQYKPSAAVYGLIPARFGMAPARVWFVSSNGWDIAGAAHYGLRTVWVNRHGLPTDRLACGPDVILPDLRELPQTVGAAL